ncbi:hypothetical protein V492_00531 [Pseudogymnoascus sp. VKM F-4246]|nr:hypothetical protein V492_00531 [Pseudogymnoascus sp. VKM F-4246]
MYLCLKGRSLYDPGVLVVLGSGATPQPLICCSCPPQIHVGVLALLSHIQKVHNDPYQQIFKQRPHVTPKLQKLLCQPRNTNFLQRYIAGLFQNVAPTAVQAASTARRRSPTGPGIRINSTSPSGRRALQQSAGGVTGVDRIHIHLQLTKAASTKLVRFWGGKQPGLLLRCPQVKPRAEKEEGANPHSRSPPGARY